VVPFRKVFGAGCGGLQPQIEGQHKMSEYPPDISAIICTQNRADSLRMTLECLASANLDGIRAEIIVVDKES
jgi:hypothetical protein